MGITCASCHSSHCPMSPASTCRRRCTGQTPLLPHSCCGSTLSIQSNFIQILHFGVLAFLSILGHHEKVQCMRKPRAYWSVLGNERLVTPVGVLKAPELSTGHSKSVYLCPVSKYNLGINLILCRETTPAASNFLTRSPSV